MRTATIYDVVFHFNKQCVHCGLIEYENTEEIFVTMVNIAQTGIPTCKHCGENLFVHTRCLVRNTEESMENCTNKMEMNNG
jgi:hypothetical protein